MRNHALILAACSSLLATYTAHADSTLLDLDQLPYETVYAGAQRTMLVMDGAGHPLSFLLRIAKGQFLPPHGAEGPIRVLTVVTGTLSWGDGRQVDATVERTFGPGSIIVLPASGGEHWAAARHDDVLLQVLLVRDGTLPSAVAAQLTR